MRITVTKVDILEGSRMNVANCAVARAVKRELNAREVLASQRGITVYPEAKKIFGFLPNPFPTWEPQYYAIPKEVSKWITQFDFDVLKTQVQPITFEMTPR